METNRSIIISSLRRLWMKDPNRSATKKRNKIGYNQYRCECCKEIFPNKEVQVHHIESCIDRSVGFISYDEFIKRLFVPEDKLKLLCLSCHKKEHKK